MMNELIQDNIGILLKSVNYEIETHTDSTERNDVSYVDEFSLVEKTATVAEFEISRKAVIEQHGKIKLKIVAGVQLYAKEGIDFTKAMTDEIIDKNKEEISKTVMVFTSSLISQITGSFNGFPLITAPVLKINK